MSASTRTTRISKNQKNKNIEASPAVGSAELADRRQLEKTVAWTGPERLRCLWYRLRLTIAEMNYATRRMTEQQMRLP
jgi:hypothetical protein